MGKVVIDANLWMVLFAREEESRIEVMSRVVEGIKKGLVEVCEPSFLLVELANVMIKKKGYREKETTKFVNFLVGLEIKFEDLGSFEISDLVRVMCRYGLTGYDAVYLKTAIDNNCKLLTEDRELLKIKEWCVDLATWRKGFKG